MQAVPAGKPPYQETLGIIRLNYELSLIQKQRHPLCITPSNIQEDVIVFLTTSFSPAHSKISRVPRRIRKVTESVWEALTRLPFFSLFCRRFSAEFAQRRQGMSFLNL